MKLLRFLSLLLTLTLFSASLSACAPARNSEAPPSGTMLETSEVLPTSTSTPTEAPTQTPLPPELKVTPEVQTQLEAQKAPYTVNQSGEAVITVAGKEITLTGLVDTKTDFGLAEDILNGHDKNTGDWYLYTEKGGWAKVIEPGTPEKRTEVKHRDFETGRVNASAALQYEKNPTIPEGAIDPQWWLIGDGSEEIRGYLGVINLIPFDYMKVVGGVGFTRSTKPYGIPTLWTEMIKNGQRFVIPIVPAKNPSPENKNQKINLNFPFDYDRFIQKGVDVSNLVDYLLKDKVNFRLLIAPDSSRSSFFNRYYYLFGSDGIFSTPGLQKPGEILGLFTKDEQARLISIWKQEALIPWGKIPTNEMSVRVVLPQELALKLPTADYDGFPWGDIQP